MWRARLGGYTAGNTTGLPRMLWANTPSPLWLGPRPDTRSLPCCAQTSGVPSAPAGGAQGDCEGWIDPGLEGGGCRGGLD